MIDIVPDEEGGAVAQARSAKQDWLKERDYRVVAIRQAELERDLAGVLDSLAAALAGPL